MASAFRHARRRNVKVRRGTLEDGGKPDDPVLDVIIDRTLELESDRQTLHFARLFAKGRKKRQDVEFPAVAISDYAECGKCDFCGSTNTAVRNDF